MTSSLSAFLGEIGRHQLLTPEQELMMGSGGDLLEMVQSELLAKPIYSNQK